MEKPKLPPNFQAEKKKEIFSWKFRSAFLHSHICIAKSQFILADPQKNGTGHFCDKKPTNLRIAMTF